LLGAGEAVVYPASNRFVARWIPTHERGVANGWIFAGVGAGAGLAPPLITYLMLHYGWRSSFWLCAVIGLVAGLVWFLVARDSPAEHPGVSPEEFALIHSGLPQQESVGRKALVPWRTVLRSPNVLAMTASYFSFGYVAWIFFSWFYIYLAQVRGLNLKASAFYAMLPFLAMSVCCAIGGVVSDKLTRSYGSRIGRCYLAAIVLDVASCFLVFGVRVDSECCLGWGRRRVVSGTELLLVGHGRHRRLVIRVGFRIHEYGCPDWWRSHSFVDAGDREPLGMDSFLRGGGSIVLSRSTGMDSCRSEKVTRVERGCVRRRNRTRCF